jgi:hypothetical protein
MHPTRGGSHGAHLRVMTSLGSSAIVLSTTGARHPFARKETRPPASEAAAPSLKPAAARRGWSGGLPRHEPLDRRVALACSFAQNEQRGRHRRRGCPLGGAVITTAPTARLLTTASGHRQPRRHRQRRPPSRATSRPRSVFGEDRLVAATPRGACSLSASSRVDAEVLAMPGSRLHSRRFGTLTGGFPAV